MELLDSYKYKTTPYKHQDIAFMQSRDKPAFALLMEQGTGKSKVLIDTAAYLWGKGRINAMVVIAPNGVHRNWEVNEIPAHMPDYVQRHVAVWTASQSKKQLKQLEDLFLGGNQLRILCMNVEALSTKRGTVFLQKFLRATNALMVLDESSRIKNPGAIRTKNILKLGDYAAYRRIATGTPITKSPFDAFAQMNFLDDEILEIKSFVAFKARYAKLLDASSPLIAKIMRNGARFMPQIEATDEHGQKIYQNLDELAAKIQDHSYRVLKKDCLDLPEKVYVRRYYEMTVEQRAAYNSMKTRLRSVWNGDQSTALNKLTMVMRLQQIVSGYHAKDGTDDVRPMFSSVEQNPKIATLLELVEELPGSVIIWCRFTQEIRDIYEALSAVYGPKACAMFYGDTPNAEREQIKADFQAGKVRFFIGNAASGGIGITLTQAQDVVYYTNELNLETRLQSEDRAHRIGQKNNVTYHDFECLETLDAKVIDSLRNKKDIADVITGDPSIDWI
jgi:SNF2 family DNA or RNA helicase